MIKAVLFDLDNTLVDFMGMKRACVEAGIDAMIDAGLKMPRKEAVNTLYELYDKYGIEYQRIFNAFLKEIIGKVDYKILGAGVSAYRKTKSAHLRTYPNVVPTLTELCKKGYKLCIVSDASKLQVWTRLADLGIHHFFDFVITYEDTEKCKDTGIPFRKVLSKLKLKAEECLAVGDWVERDIIGAKKVGIKTAFAKYGDVFNIKADESGADYIIYNINEVLEIVKKD